MRRSSALLCGVFLDLSAQCHPAHPLPSHAQTLQHTVSVLLAPFVSVMRGVLLFFLWHSSSRTKSWISFTSPLLPSAFRNFLLWPPFSANSLSTSVYITWFSVFVSILHLPFLVSFSSHSSAFYFYFFLDNNYLFIFILFLCLSYYFTTFYLYQPMHLFLSYTKIT